MIKRNNNHQSGFTIIELLVATTVFSVILLLGTTVMLQISRLYFKGLISSRTQTVSRSVIDEISRSIQFSGDRVVSSPAGYTPPSGHTGYHCVGTTRYTYFLNAQVNENVTPGTSPAASPHRARHALWKDSVPTSTLCATGLPDLTLETPSPGGVELLENGMRLGDLKVNDADNDEVYDVYVQVTYGDDDLLVLPDYKVCKGEYSGSQWCAISILSTQVFRRVQ